MPGPSTGTSDFEREQARKARRAATQARYQASAKGKAAAKKAHKRYDAKRPNHRGCSGKRRKGNDKFFVGLDGEGIGRAPHKYIALQAASENGKRYPALHNPDGLSTEQCLEYILNLPASGSSRLFSFAFNYDLTMILKDLPDRQLHALLHPETRTYEVKLSNGKTRKCHRPVFYEKYALNLVGRKFTVSAAEWVDRGEGKTRKPKVRGTKKRVVWDVFKFFQCSFVKALEGWAVGDPEKLARMKYMKTRRSEFDKESREAIEEYCFEECQYLGLLMRKLVTASSECGLHLQNFYGAGSLADAMFKQMGIGPRIKAMRELEKNYPSELNDAIMSAYFGGWFENARVGLVRGPVYNYDISSAYPYGTYFLPCFEHGQWRRTKSAAVAREATAALVKYRLEKPKTKEPWAPFPCRTEDGNIVHPSEFAGGWLWRDEFFAGQKLFPNAVFERAWVWEQTCKCHPFAELPAWYRKRSELGKDARGIPLKLGMNSVYGKCAQTRGGRGQFADWKWAGLITSGCRAQVLEMASCLSNLSHLLMVATDGIMTTEQITVPPTPKNTGTGDLSKPLGGWEEKIFPEGVFFCRPGVYFDPSPDPAWGKSKGLNHAVMMKNAKAMMAAYEKGGGATCFIHGQVDRFHGATSAVRRYRNPATGEFRYVRGLEYGQWTKGDVITSFDPWPKREKEILRPGHLGVRSLRGVKSLPYSLSNPLSPDAEALKESRVIQEEQPDGFAVADFEDAY